MTTTTAVRTLSGPQVQTWQEWKDAIADSMMHRFERPGLCILEQYVLRSQKEKRCIVCGDAGTKRQESVLIKSASHYWMCDECADYWEHRYD